jgi:hypothetical protein
MRTQLSEEWGQFLNPARWRFFCTLTSKREMRLAHMHETASRFFRRLATAARGPVYYSWCAETGGAGWVHMHALVHTEGLLDLGSIARAWRLGRADIQRYDTSRGARYYVTKSLPRGEVEYGLSLPPSRPRRKHQSDGLEELGKIYSVCPA